MHITSVIAEYNPLHSGHQFHINQTRSITEADYMITVLSGDFVQRGLPAVVDKHTRARMALEAGSDLVLELPVFYALSSGEGFGFGGVSLLEQLGCVDTLSFGTEAGSLDGISKLAQVLAREDDGYRTAIQSALKQGMTHPAARSLALKQQYPQLDSSLLDSTSNNMLALEYCKALHLLNSSIQPVTVKREGQGYLDTHTEGTGFVSATAIRKFLESAADIPSGLRTMVPSMVSGALNNAAAKGELLFLDDFSSILHYKLLSLDFDTLCTYWEVTPDFARKILKHLGSFTSFTQFANTLWTKDITYARVCRTLMHILLDMYQPSQTSYNAWDVHTPVPYARILGFRKEAAPLLSILKKKASIPLISKLADAQNILSPEAKGLLDLDIKAAHIYDSVKLHKKKFCTPYADDKASFTHEMQKQIIMI